MESVLLISNESGEEIINLRVDICDFTSIHKEIKRGTEIEIMFAANCEDGILIDATLASGRRINHEVGYVTTGLTTNYRVMITDNELALEVL